MTAWIFTPYAFLLLLPAAIAVVLAWLTRKRASAPGAKPFIALMIAAAWWSFFNTLEMIAPDLHQKTVWVNFQYPAIVALSLTWFLFTMEFTGRGKWLTRRNLVLLSILPLVTVLLVWTNHWHELVRTNIRLSTEGPYPVILKDYGPWFWVISGYAYLLTAVSTYWLIQAVSTQPYWYRRQTLPLLIAALIPWISNANYIFRLGMLPRLDITPISFTISGVLIFWNLFRARFLDVVPLARQHVIESMHTGVMVLDPDNRLIDINPAAQKMLDRPLNQLIGCNLESSFAHLLPPGQSLRLSECGFQVLSLQRNGNPFHCQLQSSPIDPARRAGAKLLLITDISEWVKANQEVDQSHKLLESMFNAIQDGICVTDCNLNILQTNATLQRWYPHVPNLVGCKCYQAFHGKDQPCESCPSRRAMAEGVPQMEIVPLETPTGRRGWLEVFAYPLFDSEGNAAGVVEYVRDISQRLHVQQALQQRLASEELLASISSRFINLSSEQVDNEIERTLKTIGEFSQSDHCFLKLFAGDGNALERLYGWCANGDGVSLPTVESILPDRLPGAMHLLQLGEAIHIHCQASPTLDLQEAQQHLERLGVQSMVAVPVTHENSLSGFLGLATTRPEGIGHEGNERLLRLLADIIMNALIHRQEEDNLRRRDAILEAVRMSAEYLLTARNWHDCIDKVLARLGEATAVSRVYLFENHRPADGAPLTSLRAEWTAADIEPQVDNPDMKNAPLWSPQLAFLPKILGRGESIFGVVKNFTEAERLFLTSQGIRSIAIVPIHIQTSWWGFLGFDDCTTERSWSESEIDALKAAANILGATIQRQQIEENLMENQARYRSLFDDSPISLWEKDLSGVVDILAKIDITDRKKLHSYLKKNPHVLAACINAMRVTDVNRATLDMFHAESKQQLLANLGMFSNRDTQRAAMEDILDISQGKTCAERQRIDFKITGERMNTRIKWTVAPGYEKTFQKVYYSVQDVTEIKRTQQELHQQRALAEALRDIAAVLTSTLELDELMDRILVNIGKVMAHDTASILLRGKGKFSLARSRGFNQEIQGAFLHNHLTTLLDTPSVRAMSKNGQPIIIPDTAQHSGWIIFKDRQWVRSHVAVPILINDELGGVIFLDSATPNFFNPSHGERLQAFTHHAAIAIRNAHLYKEIQKSAHQMKLLNEITLAAYGCVSLQDMLQTLADRMGELLDADGAFITLWDEANRRALPVAAYGPFREIYPAIPPYPDEQTLTESLLSAGHALEVEDVRNSPHISSKIIEEFPAKSLLGLPLIAGDEKLGAVIISSNHTRRFTRREIELGEQAAHQIALAIHKMQLLEAEQQQHRLTEALRDSAVALSSSLRLNDLLERILENVHKVVPHDAAIVMQLEDGKLRITHWRGYENRGMDQYLKSFHCPLEQFFTFKQMAETKKPLIIANIHECGQWVDLGESGWGHSFLGCPVVVKGETIGFLCLDSAQAGFFSTEHASRLQVFASQAAVAIESARLFEETQRLAVVDSLTGVYNRTFFDTELERLQKSRHFPISILVADMDKLKAVNDRWGHAAGDELLRQTARILQAVFRAEDIITRVGGDEFAVLLPGVDAVAAAKMVTRLQEAITEFNQNSRTIPVSISFGIATGDKGDSLMEVYREADLNMYRQKQQTNDNDHRAA